MYCEIVLLYECSLSARSTCNFFIVYAPFLRSVFKLVLVRKRKLN